MTSTPETPTSPPRPGIATRFLAALGTPVVNFLDYVGGLSGLLAQTAGWVWRSLVLRRARVGRPAIYAQLVRLGVRSLGVIALVSGCIGMILALQMAPPLEDFGQTDKVANIIAIAVFRELGPLLSAIVLTGFAGASVAAELGTMVVGEEVEALEAHALNPVRFLVVPRIVAAVVGLVFLCVLGECVAVGCGWWVGVTLLDIPSGLYISNTIEQLDLADFLTGLWKAGVFGAIIGGIACFNGLSVVGGAAGVGRATTHTVVHSIVSIIFTDLLFTAVFYRLGWTWAAAYALNRVADVPGGRVAGETSGGNFRGQFPGAVSGGATQTGRSERPYPREAARPPSGARQVSPPTPPADKPGNVPAHIVAGRPERSRTPKREEPR